VNVDNQNDANKEAHMKQRNVRMIETNGIKLKVIVEGSGPLLLLLHGFPQCGYLWRNQIDDLVAAGYQVAVPDQRGYGGSDKPADPQAYDVLTLSADAIGIADALGHETFTLVTHDWGAIVGWYLASLYPQRVNAVFALSVPPTIGTPVGALTRQENFGDNFVYTVYFQQPGVAEAELDADVRTSIRMLYYSVSGDAPEFVFMRPKPVSSKMLDGLVDPDPLPSWLTEEDLDRYVEDYRDGFRGPINWYRSIDRGIGLTRRLQQAKIMQPSHFMIGSLDPMNVLLSHPLANLEQNAPNLRGNIVLDGAGHWLPLERPKEVTAALLDFLAGLRSAPQSASTTKG
jgi:pimeloyl-ACP methyl ester carboxylesterase